MGLSVHTQLSNRNPGHESEHCSRDLSVLWTPGEGIIQANDSATSDLYYSIFFSSCLDAACDDVESTGLQVAMTQVEISVCFLSIILTWGKWLI